MSTLRCPAIHSRRVTWPRLARSRPRAAFRSMSSMAASWVSLAQRSRWRSRQDCRSTISCWMRRPKRSSKDISLDLLVASCCSKAVAMPRRRSSCSCCSSGWVSMRSSAEVAGTPHVVVRRGRGGGGSRSRRCDDQRAHGAVAKGLEFEGTPTSLFECAGAEVVGEAQDPEAYAQCLLRMDSTCGLLTQEGCGRRPNRLGTLKEALVAQLNHGAMALGPMSWLGDEPPGLRSLGVPRDGLAAVIDLDRMSADPKIHTLANETVRNRGVMALVLDVVVKEHLGALPSGVLLALNRKCSQRRPLELEEESPTTACLARERPAVV